MNNDELRSVVDANEQVLAQYQAQINSLKELRARGASDIERLRRGDDMREILIASYELRQAHWDADIRAMGELIETMRVNQKKFKQALAG